MGRKLTHSEFVDKIRAIHGDTLTITGKYVLSNTLIEVQCNRCKRIWDTLPVTLTKRPHDKKQTGCRICNTHPQTKTHEQFILDVKSLYGSKITVRGTYKSSRTPIEVQCNRCKRIWETPAKSLSAGISGCRVCAQKNVTKKKRNPETFLSELVEIHGKNIQLLDIYRNTYTRMRVQCNKCETVWETTANRLLNGSGCAKCWQLKSTKTQKDFMGELIERYGFRFQLLGGYKNERTMIEVRCNFCGDVFKVMPRGILRGTHGCLKCFKLSQFKTHNKFVVDMDHINPNILILGTYTLATAHIKVSCRLCGREWEPIGNSLMSGQGCPSKHGISLKDGSHFRSKPEALTYIKFKESGMDVECEQQYPIANDGTDLGRSRYDFYLPNLNTYVEVTSFNNKSWPYYYSYLRGICTKKQFVEKKLNANFMFIQLSPTLNEAQKGKLRKHSELNCQS